jgi:mono/diheme cytochrome c family protein
MRTTAGACALIVTLTLPFASPAAAQDWVEYRNVDDGFSVAFPGEPRVAQTTWKTELGFVLPARIYSAEAASGKYSVTVVDYRPIEAQGTERAKTCPAGAPTCTGSDLSGAAYWKHEVRGGIIDATSRLLKRDVEITHYQWSHMDLVEGHFLQLTNRADQSRTFAFVGMHEMKLYIVEGTVPKGAPQPALFQQSVGWVDRNGNGIRYESIYSNGFHGLKEYPAPRNTRASAAAQQPYDALTDEQRLGRQVLAQSCGVCHLPPARGARTYGPALHKGTAAGDDALVRRSILEGTPRMPAFKYSLQPAEIDAIVAYIRTLTPPAASGTPR